MANKLFDAGKIKGKLSIAAMEPFKHNIKHQRGLRVYINEIVSDSI